MNRIASLDGLRAFAVLFVMVDHAKSHPHFPDNASVDFVTQFVSGGVGVRIFFVISGFIITYLLMRELKATGRISFQWFYLRRAYRLLPPLVLLLLAIVLLSPALGWPLTSTEIWASLLFFRNHTQDTWITGHLWSLSVEEQFYLLWPLLFVVMRPRLVLWCVMIAAPILRTIFVLEDRTDWYYWMVSNMDAIALGCLLAIHYEPMRNWERSLGAFARRSLRCMAVISYFVLLPQFWGPYWVPWHTTSIALATAFLMLSLTTTEQGITYRVLNARAIAGLGLISYSVYLWQQLFLIRTPLVEPPIIIALALPIGVAWMSWIFIERPIGRLRVRLHK